MHDDEEVFLRSIWQRNMPFISTPTQTTDVYQAAEGGEYEPEEPPGVTVAPVITGDASSFVLGVDTCGFTTGTTGKIRNGCHEAILNRSLVCIMLITDCPWSI
jgi:hypothetical protein